MAKEMLDIVDDNGQPTGEVIDRVTALWELREELGVEVQAEDLVYCGQRKFHFEEIFHEKKFKDNQISNVYLLWMDRDAETFQIQKEELSEVRWFDFEGCMEDVKNGAIPGVSQSLCKPPN